MNQESLATKANRLMIRLYTRAARPAAITAAAIITSYYTLYAYYALAVTTQRLPHPSEQLMTVCLITAIISYLFAMAANTISHFQAWATEPQPEGQRPAPSIMSLIDPAQMPCIIFATAFILPLLGHRQPWLTTTLGWAIMAALALALLFCVAWTFPSIACRIRQAASNLMHRTSTAT